MAFQQDWVMRQIEMLVQFVARTIFHQDSISYDIIDESNLSQPDLIYNKLRELIAEREICEAENLLFENLDKDDNKSLALALDFYQNINRMTDDELEAHNFSRQEINDGVREILHMFNISTLNL